MRPVPGLPIEQQPEQVLRRLLVWGEARGESALGKVAILDVVKNRVAKKAWGVREVILQPMQFSCFNQNDPNRTEMLSAYITDRIGWGACDAIVELWEADGCVPDLTKGATHYCTLDLWRRPTPEGRKSYWFEQPEIDAGHTIETIRIGHHVFASAS